MSRSRSRKRGKDEPARSELEDEEDDADTAEQERRRQRDRKTPHFKWERGVALGPKGRYKVESQIGEGTFGRVLKCSDESKNATVAVKVVKGVRRYCDDAEVEAEVLHEIRKRDPNHRSRCVQLLDTFVHSGRHYCLVFECLDMSLRDLLKANHSRGLLMRDVQTMAGQLVECLHFLHSIDLVHTDLKCRNVILRDSRHSMVPLPRAAGTPEVMSPHCCDISVIDFGGACFGDERHEGRIGTRQYRAPESVLGLPWDEKADIWSAGCIAALLYMGKRPFQVHDSREHLAVMEKVLGYRIPRSMVRKAIAFGPLPDGIRFDFADDCHRLLWPGGADEEAVEHVASCEPLPKVVQPQHLDFLALLQGMLEIDPRRRLSAEACLRGACLSGEGQLPE